MFEINKNYKLMVFSVFHTLKYTVGSKIDQQYYFYFIYAFFLLYYIFYIMLCL